MTSLIKTPSEKILVIKLSALGDFIQALGPMKAIRNHHPKAHITLLTTKTFKNFGEQCGYFNEVWIDKRPKIFDLKGWYALRTRLNSGDFKRVYDLQNNDRTAFYLKLFSASKRPEWVGAAPGASHRNASAQRTAGHAYDGHVQTLKRAGIETIKIDDLSWIKADLGKFALTTPYLLLVPGSAPQHPQKRWPTAHYADLAKELCKQGYQPVLLGTEAEKDVTKKIKELCSEVCDLTGQTSLFEIAALAHKAAAAIGNDTGPMHMIGPTGIPCIVLFSSHSNPLRHTPKGKNVATIQKESLSDLPPEDVLKKLEKILKA